MSIDRKHRGQLLRCNSDQFQRCRVNHGVGWNDEDHVAKQSERWVSAIPTSFALLQGDGLNVLSHQLIRVWEGLNGDATFLISVGKIVVSRGYIMVDSAGRQGY